MGLRLLVRACQELRRLSEISVNEDTGIHVFMTARKLGRTSKDFVLLSLLRKQEEK